MPALSRPSSPPADAPNPALPAGFDELTSDYYVAPSLRELYRRDTTAERKRLAVIPSDRPVVARVAGRERLLFPYKSNDDAELFLHLAAVGDASARLAGNEKQAEMEARDAKTYGCDACGQVVLPTAWPGGPSTRVRHLHVGGAKVGAKLCGDCFASVESRLREAAMLPDGRTRAKVADEYVARLTKAAAS